MAARGAPVFGNLQEYEQENELFSSYLERVQLFFTANDVSNEKKVAVFLSMVGSKTYSLLRNLLAPTLPSEKTFDELVATLKSHFEPKPLVIAERFHFHQRTQNVGESITEYVAELRRLTTHCQYGAHLEEALRDRLVCGMREVHTQKKLLAIEDLTLAKALKIAQGEEAADRNSRVLKGAEPIVNFVARPSSSRRPSCYRCGRSSHNQKDCYFKDANCYNCGKRGHVAEVCRVHDPPNQRLGVPAAHRAARRQGSRNMAPGMSLPPRTITSQDRQSYHIHRRSTTRTRSIYLYMLWVDLHLLPLHIRYL